MGLPSRELAREVSAEPRTDENASAASRHRRPPCSSRKAMLLPLATDWSRRVSTAASVPRAAGHWYGGFGGPVGLAALQTQQVSGPGLAQRCEPARRRREQAQRRPAGECNGLERAVPAGHHRGATKPRVPGQLARALLAAQQFDQLLTLRDASRAQVVVLGPLLQPVEPYVLEADIEIGGGKERKHATVMVGIDVRDDSEIEDDRSGGRESIDTIAQQRP